MIGDAGYNHMYDPAKVRNYAKHTLARLKELREKLGDFDVVVHGNSGVSIGFAALALSDFDSAFNLFLLRKDNDNSHGAPFEGPAHRDMARYIILDDFVSTGNTVRRIVSKLEELASLRCRGPAECVGVLQYTRSRKRSAFTGLGVEDPDIVEIVYAGARAIPCYGAI